MAGRARALGVQLRPHMKTAKSAEVARLAAVDGRITVSTLAEARYFLQAGFRDITYAVGLAPARIAEAQQLAQAGADLKLLTDNADVARALASAADPARPLNVLIEVDCGDRRAGLPPTREALLPLAALLVGRPGVWLEGVLTHAGHSYACRSVDEIAAVAEAERAAAVQAAEVLRESGIACNTVSVGSTPTATHARGLSGVTEMRPGVYMLGDLDQVGLQSLPEERVAATVLAGVIGVYADRAIIDAGGLALSKDTSAQRHGARVGYGKVQRIDGEPMPGVYVARANQEHGVIQTGDGQSPPGLRVGDRVRVVPNHICMTAAAHPGYHVLEGGRVVARWPRINGWEQWGGQARLDV